ncbi:MAG: FtsX-like permease family protein [Paludibacteraceae bacterium]|nr:FtsX-like permease family protein [Paludibacteraceae bacterium]
MQPSLFIARRYLVSKKSHNAINIISGVSAAAVAVVTAAMLCVMSVLNGFEDLIEGMFSRFDADIRIETVEGKSFDCANEVFDKVRNLKCVEVFCQTLEETALAEYEDKQIPVMLKGVDEHFEELTEIDSIIVDGSFDVYDGAFDRAVLGLGLANQLGAGAHFVRPLHVYAPKREGRVNMLNPEKSFERGTCFMSGVFAVNQSKYDDQMMLVSLDMARKLFHYGETEVTAVECKVTNNGAKEQIKSILGDGYKVMDRYEQQEDFFRIVRIEKLLTTLLLAFILLIASFNLLGSLTMLIIDKKANMQTLRHLGASDKMIRRIFMYEGWMISLSGAVAGIVLGIAVCWSQERFGWLKMGNGVDYIVSSYPVSLQWGDVLVVMAIVVLTGLIASAIPSYKSTKEQEG